MMIILPGVLDRNQVTRILDVLSKGEFVDGRLSAGDMARDVKNNLEYRQADPQDNEIHQTVLKGLSENEQFQNFAMPKQIVPPVFSRYDVGMEYGLHVDSPIMGRKVAFRSDLSSTIFLSDPTTYDGGELVIETTFGEQPVKLAPGDAVVYMSTTLHRVAPVTRGARIVALTWVQCLVKDEGIREVLYDIQTAARNLGDGKNGVGAAEVVKTKDRLYKAYSNLMRRSADV
jgi:PKHD-type hydroxylase